MEERDGLVQKIRLGAEQASRMYYRLLVVSDVEGEGGRYLAEDLGIRRIHVGEKLAEELLEVPARGRPLKAAGLLEDILDDAGGDGVLLDHIEILFEESLKVEPLTLLRSVSRRRLVVVMWSGGIEAGTLVYGVPGHPEYRSYPAGLEAGTEGGVWDFVESHLRQLPIVVEKDGAVEPVAERMGYLLFDRMVAFHVQRGVSVPLSAAEFYAGLKQRYPERDGMYFVPEHVTQYDRKRVKARELLELQLFITGESSAIQWLRQELTKKPQTFQELSPEFMKDLGWAKHEKFLELDDLLRENFLRYKEGEPIPHQILSWMKQSAKHRPKITAAEEKPDGIPERGLETHDPEMISAAKDRWYVPDPNRAQDLEKLREAALHKEFETYRQAVGGKKLKVFRLEAVRAGFGKAWRDREYGTIIEVAKKVPGTVLQEDPKLLMYYDNALDRTEE